MADRPARPDPDEALRSSKEHFLDAMRKVEDRNLLTRMLRAERINNGFDRRWMEARKRSR